MFNPSTMVRIKEEEEPEEMFVCIARPSWPVENVQQAVVKKEEAANCEWALDLNDLELPTGPSAMLQEAETSEEQRHHCSHCGQSFAFQSLLLLHQRERPFVCTASGCTKAYKRKDHLTRHTRTKHRDPTETSNAQVDSTALQSLQTLPTTVLQDAEPPPASTSTAPHPSTGPTPHKCSHCGKYFISSSELRLHKRERRFPCTVPGCTKTFRKNRNLTLHLRLHSNTGSFKCTWPGCQKTFNFGRQQQDHLNTHTGERPHRCPHCPSTFKQRSVLTAHLRRHSGQPYQCELCSKQFTMKRQLRQHLRLHRNTRPFKCTWPGCTKAFTTRTKQEDHLNTHTGTKPHRCPHCPSAFNDRSTLTVHLRLHTGQLPHQCQLCSKRFNTKQHLTSHMRTRKHRDHTETSNVQVNSTALQTSHTLPTAATAHHPPPVPLSFESADHHVAPVQVETETEDQIRKEPAAWVEDCVKYKLGETINEEDEEEEECECSECLASLDSLHSR